MPDAAANTLELRDLHKRYGDHVAVAGISLSVQAGEFVTLLGPSGSGKTTTLNMIAGFVDPTSGDIRLGGGSVGSVPAHRRDIGVVFQNYALFPHMTALQNVMFPLAQRDVPKRERTTRAEQALGLVHLSGFGGRYPSELSGGQQQRVALARAIVFQPRLLLMDEPLGALDRKLREALQIEIKEIHQRLGITFVYVTHDQDEALALSDRIAVFNEGRIEQVATPEELYARPKTVFVAGFLGEANIIEGTIERRNGVAALCADGFTIQAPALTELANGDRAALVVRPEHIAVCPASDQVVANANAIEGRVQQVVYLGSERKLLVDHPSGQRFVVRESAAQPATVGAGEPARMVWKLDDGVLIPSG